MQDQVTAFAPGRVNLIGDHTDHTGGLCLPVALSMGVTISGRRGGDRVRLESSTIDGQADLPLHPEDPAVVEPPWARYVAGVIAELSPATGFRGRVTSDLPVGAGLSSSAALEVATALALGFEGEPLDLAERCQRAEHRASGVPCGILDQLTSVAGVDGHALLIDCRERSTRPVAVPDGIDFVVVHSGQARTLAGSGYAARRRECEQAETRIGPLRDASVDDVEGIDVPVLRRRARHVVTENERVRAAATALLDGDGERLGELFDDSHRSLRDDFEVSVPAIETTVARLRARTGVLGVRMTGGGFGGCVVAVCEPGALDEGWLARPGPGAHVG